MILNSNILEYQVTSISYDIQKNKNKMEKAGIEELLQINESLLYGFEESRVSTLCL